MFRHSDMKIMNGIVLVAITLATALFMGSVIMPATAASNSPQTFPYSTNKALSAKWWQWAFSFPADVSPLTDSTGDRCQKGNLGNVFFLAGTSVAPFTAERHCTISHKQAILFPVINAACLLNVEKPIPCFSGDPVTTLDQLKKEIKAQADVIDFVGASLDGKAIPGVSVNGPARVQSPLFKTTVVDNVPFTDTPAGKYTGLADGYFVHLKPLSIGEHTIHFKGAVDNAFVTEVTYHLTVK